MKKYGSPLNDLRLYSDEKLCEIRQNIVDDKNDKLPEFVQDWLKPRTEIKGNNRRLIIAIRFIEGIMVRRFIQSHA